METVVLYVLECGHIMPSGPETKDAVVCRLCNMARKIRGVHVYEWRAKCNGCNFSRWTGLSQDNAERAANRHSHSMNHPDVRVEYRMNPLADKAQSRLKSHRIIV